MSLRLKTFQQCACREHGLRTVGAHSMVAAVMHQDHVTSANLSKTSLHNLRSRWNLPVVAGHVPHHRLQYKRARNAKSSRSASTKGRTEQTRCLSGSVFDGANASLQLGTSFAAVFKDQIGMREGVVADHMASLHDLVHNVGPLLHEAADHEECGLYVMLCQNFQQPECVRVIRAIVVSQSHLLGSAGQARKSSAVPLPSRRQGLVSRHTRCGDCSRSDERPEHPGHFKSSHWSLVVGRWQNQSLTLKRHLNAHRKSHGVHCCTRAKNNPAGSKN